MFEMKLINSPSARLTGAPGSRSVAGRQRRTPGYGRPISSVSRSSPSIRRTSAARRHSRYENAHFFRSSCSPLNLISESVNRNRFLKLRFRTSSGDGHLSWRYNFRTRARRTWLTFCVVRGDTSFMKTAQMLILLKNWTARFPGKTLSRPQTADDIVFRGITQGTSVHLCSERCLSSLLKRQRYLVFLPDGCCVMLCSCKLIDHLRSFHCF